MIYFAIYNQLEENLIIRLNIRISRQGSRDFIQESLHVRERRGPQTPYLIHVYKSRFLLHDFILQTSSMEIENIVLWKYASNGIQRQLK